MNRSQKIIEKEQDLIRILEAGQASRTVYEAEDDQQNIFSLGLEHIVGSDHPDASPVNSEGNDHILTKFRPLQKGSSELRINWDYTFSYRDNGKTFCFNGVLMNGDPRSFLLTFNLHNEVYRLESRRSYRIPIETPDRVSAQIEEENYRVINLSIGGVGIHTHDANRFQIGQEIVFKLLYKDQVLSASGAIKHIAPLAREGFICGIALAYHTEDSMQHLQAFIQDTHHKRRSLLLMSLVL